MVVPASMERVAPDWTKTWHVIRNGPSAAARFWFELMSPHSDVHEPAVTDEAVMPISEAYDRPASQKFPPASHTPYEEKDGVNRRKS